MGKTATSKITISLFVGCLVVSLSATLWADKVAPDQFEPNNSYKDAVLLDPEQQEFYDDLSITKYDRDWFKVEVKQGQSLHVRIFFDHDDANIDMSIFYMTKGKLIHMGTSATLNDEEELLLQELPAGVYYMYHRDHGSPGRYKMRVKVF